jgi:hypothetical protein
MVLPFLHFLIPVVLRYAWQSRAIMTCGHASRRCMLRIACCVLHVVVCCVSCVACRAPYVVTCCLGYEEYLSSLHDNHHPAAASAPLRSHASTSKPSRRYRIMSIRTAIVSFSETKRNETPRRTQAAGRRKSDIPSTLPISSPAPVTLTSAPSGCCNTVVSADCGHLCNVGSGVL